MEAVLTCIMIGVGFAGLLGYWNAQGILVDEYIAGSITITDLQTVVVFLFGIVGAVIGVLRK